MLANMHMKIYVNQEMHTKPKNITRQTRKKNIQTVVMNSRQIKCLVRAAFKLTRSVTIKRKNVTHSMQLIQNCI